MVIRTKAMTKRDTASKLGQGQKAGLYSGPDPLNGKIDNVDASLMEGVSHDPGPYPSSTKIEEKSEEFADANFESLEPYPKSSICKEKRQTW
ncbi:hypothetical protein ACOSQ2_014715 [Xanthoceras sorbifolium]